MGAGEIVANPPGFIPDDQFKPDEPQASPAHAIMPMHAGPQTPGFIPDDQFISDAEKYGGLGQQAIAGLEGLAGGATLNLSKLAETKLLGIKPEDIKAREEANPITAGVGQVAGGIGLIAGTGGAGALAEGAGALGKIGAMAAEGGAFGAANAVDDYALGDPSLNAQKVLAHIGMGAAFGGGLGALIEGAGPALKYAGSKASAINKAVKSVYGGAEEAAMPAAEEAISTVVDAPKTGVQPTSYQEIIDKVAAAKARGEHIELPQGLALDDALNRVEMENPVHPLQRQSLENQELRDIYQTHKEMPSPEGAALREYEALQKSELEKKTAQDIGSLHPENAPQINATKGGNRTSEIFTEQYKNEKKILGPIFEKLKATELPWTESTFDDVLGRLVKAVPGISEMIDTSAPKLKFHPWSADMGIEKATYTAVQDALKALDKNPRSFQKLAAIRDSMDQNIDVMAQGAAPSQIRAAKAAFMDYLQESVQKNVPELEVREAFKRYAINEQERKVIEKTFGASVGTPEFGSISKIKPEYINDRIFSNTATVKAAKQILEPKEFKEILANWLAENKAKVTDNNVFSSNKWNSFLRNNQDALAEAFADNPQSLQKLRDMTTIMRILPDAKSINPSGTAKTLIHALKGSHSLTDLGANMLGFLKEKTVGKIAQEVQKAKLNQELAGIAAKSKQINALKQVVEDTTKKIQSSAKSIFSNNTVRGGVSAAAGLMAGHSFDKTTSKIHALANDPEGLSNHLEKHTAGLIPAAPNIVQGIHSSVITGLQFLDSKIPKPNSDLPLSAPWEPTKSQISQFNRYYAAVDDPISSLKDIKSGSLSNETMEALQVVHPHLLADMQQSVLENMKLKSAKNLTYSTKIALAKFMGAPMDNGMLPQVVASNQATFMLPSKSDTAGGSKGVKSTAAGLQNLNVSGRAKTQTERAEEEVV